MSIVETLNRLLPSRSNDLGLTSNTLLLAMLIGFAIILARYAAVGVQPLATACMWAASCLISGAGVGFIFGIPRVVQGQIEGRLGASSTPSNQLNTAAQQEEAADQGLDYRQEVNSNLVEISDWLTKIIVGLGLVNLEGAPELLDRTASTLARGLGTVRCGATETCGDYAFATALIVAFCILGFFVGYLYTRLFLAGAFSRADRSVNNLLARTGRVIQQEKAGSAEGSQEVADWQVRVAERISQLPEAKDPTSAVSALQQLAREYDSIRSELPSGDMRTRRMGNILVRMRALSLAGYPAIARFADSASPGNRLVAIAMLQLKPDVAYLPWLLDRVTLEKPFIAYHAIEALRRAADMSDTQPRQVLRELLVEWVKTEKARLMLASGNDRAQSLKSLLQHLDISI